MKMQNKFLYKTIKAIRFYASLFDLDTGKSYKLVSAYGLPKSGYFLLNPANDGRWVVLKKARTPKIEHYNLLPYLTRIRLYQFLVTNYGFSSKIQKEIEELDL
jgi:hypothetical protein